MANFYQRIRHHLEDMNANLKKSSFGIDELINSIDNVHKELILIDVDDPELPKLEHLADHLISRAEDILHRQQEIIIIEDETPNHETTSPKLTPRDRTLTNMPRHNVQPMHTSREVQPTHTRSDTKYTSHENHR